MNRLLLRLVAFPLVLCLIVDPVVAHAFAMSVNHRFICHAETHASLFSQQAISTRALNVVSIILGGHQRITTARLGRTFRAAKDWLLNVAIAGTLGPVLGMGAGWTGPPSRSASTSGSTNVISIAAIDRLLETARLAYQARETAEVTRILGETRSIIEEAETADPMHSTKGADRHHNLIDSAIVQIVKAHVDWAGDFPNAFSLAERIRHADEHADIWKELVPQALAQGMPPLDVLRHTQSVVGLWNQLPLWEQILAAYQKQGQPTLEFEEAISEAFQTAEADVSKLGWVRTMRRRLKTQLQHLQEAYPIPARLLASAMREQIQAHYQINQAEGDQYLERHQRLLDYHFMIPLREIAQGRRPTKTELHMLEETLLADDVQRAIIGADRSNVSQIVRERIGVLQKAWPEFNAWWREHFKLGEADEDKIPVDSLWRIYIPLSQWIVEQKRAKKPTDDNPNALYMIGVYGSQGRGKTVMSRALVPVLNAILDPQTEGQAYARAVDDYYLGNEARAALKPLGYDPGEEGVSNRGPAGTHDTKWILRNVEEMKHSTPASKIMVSAYEKIDEKRIPNYRGASKEIKGKIGIFLFDGWFTGCDTDFDIDQIPKGTFPRTVAEALQGDYKRIDDQMDALWAFDTPPFDEIWGNREQQEQLQERQAGSRQMSPKQIEAFVRYFYQMSWQQGVTSPIPPTKNITFYATIHRNRRFATLEHGGRRSSPIEKVGQMGKRAQFLNLKGTTAWVQNSLDQIRSLRLIPRGAVRVNALEEQIRTLLPETSTNKESILQVLKLLEHSPPQLATYTALVDDLFGFSGNPQPFIALYQEFAPLSKNPQPFQTIALLHELMEYLVSSGKITLVLQNNEIRILRSSDELARIPLTRPDARRQLEKGNNPHYLIRAWQRQIFGDLDIQLTREIKRRQTTLTLRERGGLWQTNNLGAAVQELYRAYTGGSTMTDLNMPPLVVVDENNEPIGRIQDGDPVFCWNFRTDRMRELVSAFVLNNFPHYHRPPVRPRVWTMNQYSEELSPPVVEGVVLQPNPVRNTITEVLSRLGFTQFRVSVPEKGSHVTNFLKGDRDQLFPGEIVDIVPSVPGTKLNAPGITDVVLEMINAEDKYTIHYSESADHNGMGVGKSYPINADRFLVVNYPDGDVRGHQTYESGVQGVKDVDEQLKRIIEPLREKGYWVVISADHGSVEKMIGADGRPFSQHSTNPVPFVLIWPKYLDPYFADESNRLRLKEGMANRQVAPTILKLLGLEQYIPTEWEPGILADSVEIASSDHPKRAALVVFDGRGINPDRNDPGDATRGPQSAYFDSLWQEYPHTTLKAAGQDVGLREVSLQTGDVVMGNSEVGHKHLGAGRLLYESMRAIDEKIGADGAFDPGKVPALVKAIETARDEQRPLHLIGMASENELHSSLLHLYATLRLAAKLGLKDIYIHAITDGMDTPQYSFGEKWLPDIQDEIWNLSRQYDDIHYEVVTAVGRLIAMDRDQKWDPLIRITQDALMLGEDSKTSGGREKREVLEAWQTLTQPTNHRFGLKKTKALVAQALAFVGNASEEVNAAVKALLAPGATMPAALGELTKDGGKIFHETIRHYAVLIQAVLGETLDPLSRAIQLSAICVSLTRKTEIHELIEHVLALTRPEEIIRKAAELGIDWQRACDLIAQYVDERIDRNKFNGLLSDLDETDKPFAKALMESLPEDHPAHAAYTVERPEWYLRWVIKELKQGTPYAPGQFSYNDTISLSGIRTAA